MKTYPVFFIFLGSPRSGGISSSVHTGLWPSLRQTAEGPSARAHPPRHAPYSAPLAHPPHCRGRHGKNPVEGQGQDKGGKGGPRKRLSCSVGSFFNGKILELSTYPSFISVIGCVLQISVKNDLHRLSVPAHGSMMQSSPAIVVAVKS